MLNDISEFYLKIPQTPFKLGQWDCYLLSQWVRSYFDVNPLPKAKYNEPVDAQCKRLFKAIDPGDKKHLDIVTVANFGSRESCLGTLIEYEHQGKSDWCVVTINYKATIMRLDELDIIGFYRHE